MWDTSQSKPNVGLMFVSKKLSCYIWIKDLVFKVQGLTLLLLFHTESDIGKHMSQNEITYSPGTL